jgi:hypothetical protein
MPQSPKWGVTESLFPLDFCNNTITKPPWGPSAPESHKGSERAPQRAGRPFQWSPNANDSNAARFVPEP